MKRAFRYSVTALIALASLSFGTLAQAAMGGSGSGSPVNPSSPAQPGGPSNPQNPTTPSNPNNPSGPDNPSSPNNPYTPNNPGNSHSDRLIGPAMIC